jgi:hypothetical protein
MLGLGPALQSDGRLEGEAVLQALLQRTMPERAYGSEPLRCLDSCNAPCWIRTNDRLCQRAKTEPPIAEVPQPVADPGLAPLDPVTIHQLYDTIRALPRPAMEGFTKAFRKRLQVQPEAHTIADQICERRHHDWIEDFLVHQAVG